MRWQKKFAAIVKIFGMIALLSACATTPQQTPPLAPETSRYSEEYFINSQGLKIFARTWHPQGQARANVIVLHGTALHSGIYAAFAEQLTQAGIRVFAYDMQGWGRSQGLGEDGYVESFDDYAKDLYRVLNKMKINYPDTPNYVVGESLGGAVAVYGTLKKKLWLDGVITSAVGYKANPEILGIRAPGFVNSMYMTMAQWWGQGTPNMPLLSASVGIRMVVEDDALQAALLADPYVSQGWLPVAYGSTLVDASDYIDDHLEELSLPILLIHGEKDMLVPISSSQEIYDRTRSSIKHVVVLDSPHTVLLENARDKAAREIVSFIDEVNATAKVASR